MADRVLRGSRLGSVSYETDRHVELAPRMTVEFDCDKGHRTSLTLAEDAEVPTHLGVPLLRGARRTAWTASSTRRSRSKPARTHWDMLLERRTVADLEDVLAERLQLLRQHRPKSA